MKITIEFDDKLKPILAKMLSPAMDKARNPSKQAEDEIFKKDYLAALEVLTKLDFELNMGKGDAYLGPKSEDEIIKQKNAFITCFMAEQQKTDCDFLKLFSYAQLAAEWEMKVVMIERKKAEGMPALVNLFSGACMMMEAAKAYAHLHGNAQIEKACAAALRGAE